MMNKVLAGVTAVLLVAVVFLFYKVNKLSPEAPEKTEEKAVEKKAGEELPQKEPVKAEAVGNAPTGKVAFINIDRINKESLELKTLQGEADRRRQGIEGAMESMSREYQTKRAELERNAQAGIMPEKDLEVKAQYLASLEKQAQNKQIELDNLSESISRQKVNFEDKMRALISKWNAGRYDYVLTYTETVPTIMYANSMLDVTDQIVAEMNTAYSESKPKK